jgi:RimJ/RimL family protein N-acetyltransferase
LNCEILEHNEASIKCAKAAGFRQEGVKRESVFKDQKYYDSFCYGLLVHEFLVGKADFAEGGISAILPPC